MLGSGAGSAKPGFRGATRAPSTGGSGLGPVGQFCHPPPPTPAFVQGSGRGVRNAEPARRAPRRPAGLAGSGHVESPPVAPSGRPMPPVARGLRHHGHRRGRTSRVLPSPACLHWRGSSPPSISSAPRVSSPGRWRFGGRAREPAASMHCHDGATRAGQRFVPWPQGRTIAAKAHGVMSRARGMKVVSRGMRMKVSASRRVAAASERRSDAGLLQQLSPGTGVDAAAHSTPRGFRVTVTTTEDGWMRSKVPSGYCAVSIGKGECDMGQGAYSSGA